jgi:hypothetical protein
MRPTGRDVAEKSSPLHRQHLAVAWPTWKTMQAVFLLKCFFCWRSCSWSLPSVGAKVTIRCERALDCLAWNPMTLAKPADSFVGGASCHHA